MIQPEFLVATHELSPQSIVLRSLALEHIAHHRQVRWYAREAGGQLFGQQTKQGIEIVEATGPYWGDERSRYGYRSNPRTAQQTIDAKAAADLFYLGEWHTHPEARPNASGEDMSTFETLMRQSTLRLSDLILLIQGTEVGSDGLALYSSGANGVLKWSISTGLPAHTA